MIGFKTNEQPKTTESFEKPEKSVNGFSAHCLFRLIAPVLFIPLGIFGHVKMSLKQREGKGSELMFNAVILCVHVE